MARRPRHRCAHPSARPPGCRAAATATRRVAAGRGRRRKAGDVGGGRWPLSLSLPLSRAREGGRGASLGRARAAAVRCHIAGARIYIYSGRAASFLSPLQHGGTFAQRHSRPSICARHATHSLARPCARQADPAAAAAAAAAGYPAGAYAGYGYGTPAAAPAVITETLECPRDCVGRVIGRGGETIMRLQAQSGEHCPALPLAASRSAAQRARARPQLYPPLAWSEGVATPRQSRQGCGVNLKRAT